VQDPEQPENSRVPINEEIVARLGTLIGAAVCEPTLVYMPQQLAGWEFRQGYVVEVGWAHGSLATSRLASRCTTSRTATRLIAADDYRLDGESGGHLPCGRPLRQPEGAGELLERGGHDGRILSSSRARCVSSFAGSQPTRNYEGSSDDTKPTQLDRGRAGAPVLSGVVGGGDDDESQVRSGSNDRPSVVVARLELALDDPKIAARLGSSPRISVMKRSASSRGYTSRWRRRGDGVDWNRRR